MYKHLLVLLFALIIVSCQISVNHEMPDEALIEQLLQDNPDSLAYILEEEIVPGNLSGKQKADYAWWLTKTHIQQRRSLMNDTLIHYTIDYYREIQSPRLLEAYMLGAKQASWSGNEPQQEEYLLNEAIYVAEMQKDTSAIQTICSELLNLPENIKDTDKIQRLIQITKRFAGGRDNITTCSNLARLFGRLEQIDSALFYTHKGIELAQKQKDYRTEYLLTRHYVENLNIVGQSNKSLEILRQMESKIPVGNEIKLNYINTWINLGELDSAQVYVDSYRSLIDEYRSQIIEANATEISILEALLGTFQAVIDTKKGKRFDLSSVGSPINSILDNSRNQIKIDREQQFVQDKLVRDNLVLAIERAKLNQTILWAGIVVLILVIVLVFVYQRKLLRKERYVQQVREQLRIRAVQLAENESVISKNELLINDLSNQLDETGEMKQEIGLLVIENDELKQKNRILQKDIDLYSKSINKKDEEVIAYERLAEQNAKLQERERFLTARLISYTGILDKLSKKPRYIEISQWPEILHEMNQLFDGFSYRLHTDYPSLTEEDIYYCCLFKLRLSTSIISVLMGISPSSVTKRKQRIKEKMNQQRPNEILKEQSLEIGLWNY